MFAPDVVNSFWARVDRAGPGGCWLWTGCTTTGAAGGYGQVQIGGVRWRTHRVSWALTHGPIPADLKVLHRCDVRACVNPEHLFLGTAKDNSEDMVRKGRANSRIGEQVGNSKLTPEKVIDIRRRARRGETEASIASRLGVGEVTVHDAAVGKTWRSVTGEAPVMARRGAR